jgi:SpoVK/Ycf46/Vps4 family AAA+-type ATPase
MKKPNVIEIQLASRKGWDFVKNSRAIIELLEGSLKKDEKVYDFAEGFTDSFGRIGAAVILIITDRRLIFIDNEKKPRAEKSFNLDDVSAAAVRKMRSSVGIDLSIRGSEISINTTSTENRAHTIVEHIKFRGRVQHSGTKTSFADESSAPHPPVNPGSLEMMLERLNSIQKDLVSGNLENSSVEDAVEMETLFSEAVKLKDAFSVYMKKGADPKLKNIIADDLIFLSSLSAVREDSLSEHELKFISLVMLPFNVDGSQNGSDLESRTYSLKKYSPEFDRELIEYWNTISAYSKERKIAEKGELFYSLKYIRAYDKKNGTVEFDKLSTAYKQFAQWLVKADGAVTPDEEERLKRISILMADIAATEGVVEAELTAEEPETLEEVMKGIDKLVGMDNIKNEIKTFINVIKVHKEREARDLPVSPFSLHAVFYGPPGTGKTTIARMLGRVYKALGLLSKGHIVETDRAGLIAGYVGQTAAKVDGVVQESLDGILFIDEAYSLTSSKGQNDFGGEAVDALLKRMEDYRDRLAVIAAGYPDEMEEFIESNPGLKSRFRRYFYFDHYNPEELLKIYMIFSKNVSFVLTEGAEAKLKALLTKCYDEREKSFGNGRLVRNLFEKTVENQANRIAGIAPLTDEILCSITEADIPDNTREVTFGRE